MALRVENFPDQPHTPKTTKTCNPCLIAISAAAFLALGAVVIGALSIAAGLSGSTSLAVMGHIGWKVGTALTAAGMIALVILGYLYMRQQDRDEGVEEAQIPVTIKRPPTIITPQPPPQPEPQKPITFPPVSPPVAEPVKEVMKELGIEDLVSRLDEIYGKNKRPYIPQFAKGEEELLTKTRITLIVESDEHILALPLQTIEEFSDIERNTIFHRLSLIDNKQTHEERPLLDGVELSKMTLTHLRALKGDLAATEVPEKCRGFLTAIQIQEAIEACIDAATLQALLPTETQNERLYTEARLEGMDSTIVTPRLKDLTFAQLHLLPLDYFTLPEFPWDSVCSAEGVTAVLQAGYEETRKTKQILDLISLDRIRKLTPFLATDHLTLIKTEYLKDEQFPWSEFFKKEGIGGKMYGLAPDVLASKHIPWLEIVKKQKEIDAIFPTNVHYQSVTGSKLSALDYPAIKILAPALSAEHFALFKEEKLKHQDFPWSEFLQKKGIGGKIYGRGPDVLASKHIPWLEIVKKQEEIDAIFPTNVHYQSVTGSKLNALDYPAIKILAPALSAEHFALFKEEKLKHQDFPWSEFFKKEGIGEKMRSKGADVFITQHFLWEEFSHHEKEAKTLFETSSWNNKPKAILEKIEVKQIKVLIAKDIITMNHISLLSDERQKELLTG